MIGYKAFDKDLKCRGFQFEVGKTYQTGFEKENLELCTNTVFHFCRELNKIEDVSNYTLADSRICEVIATGDIVTDGKKYGTNELQILREIPADELKEYDDSNSGNCNSGDRNSGDWNSGDWNSGDRNSGNCNSGDWNSGDRNSGNCNSGNCNSGDSNSGDSNSGNCNSGDRNSGNCNSGDCNSGDRNSGNCNSGNCNSGDRNSGNWNSGNCNSGNCNSGDRNSGNWNSGNWNSGDCNSGNRNSGDWNSGNWNSGDGNSGDSNSGDWNSGDWNSGNWNSGDGNSGFFNTETPFVRIFNKETKFQRNDINFPVFLYFDLTVWVSHDTATDEEKEKYKKEIEVSGGFLKTLAYKDAFRLAWDKAGKEEHRQLLDLPNWDNEIFKEISGIDAEAEIAKES